MSEPVNPDHAEMLRILGGRIKQARKDRGLCGRDMVVQHDFHEAEWRGYEAGGSSFTLSSLVRIAKALGLSLSILLDGVAEFSMPKESPPESITASEKTRKKNNV